MGKLKCLHVDVSLTERNVPISCFGVQTSISSSLVQSRLWCRWKALAVLPPSCRPVPRSERVLLLEASEGTSCKAYLIRKRCRAAAIAVRARARLLPSLLSKKWRSWVRILAKSTLSHKTIHSPAVGPPLPPIPRLQVAMMCQGSPPPERGHVGMVHAECRAPGITKKKVRNATATRMPRRAPRTNIHADVHRRALGLLRLRRGRRQCQERRRRGRRRQRPPQLLVPRGPTSHGPLRPPWCSTKVIKSSIDGHSPWISKQTKVLGGETRWKRRLWPSMGSRERAMNCLDRPRSTNSNNEGFSSSLHINNVHRSNVLHINHDLYFSL